MSASGIEHLDADAGRLPWPAALAAERAPAGPLVAPRHGARDVAMRRLLAMSDVCAMAAALGAALALSAHPRELAWGLLTLPAWVVVFKAYGLYDRDIKRISHMSLDDLPWIFHALLVGCLGLFAFYKLTPAQSIEVSILAAFGGFATVAVVALRALSRRLAVRMLGPERVLLVGESDQLSLLARKMRAHREYGVEPVGLISLGGRIDLELPRVVARHRVERVVVAHGDLVEAELLELLRSCRRLGVKMSVLPQLFDALGPSVEVDDVEGVTVLGINPPVLPRSSRLLKRAMDLAGATAGLLLTAPLWVPIAAAIKLDSPGPVLFRQRRIGRGGRPFELVKFRTMSVDAEDRRAALLAESRDPGWLKLDDDPRITRVGGVLRRWSLDEVPQLWNVVRGEMSLVGPRPLIESEDRQLIGWRRSRVDLTPGLTGLWQVLGRTSIPFEEMIKLDYLYVTNWTLWTDVRLILRTLPAVLLRRGAN
ncbi:MAG: exopolysaccharide biosynthesis polyprenyl glycosylphosphotransferase [Thermoleophilaceae bacterium]